MTQTIEIGSRTFTASRDNGKHTNNSSWILTGKRGATYVALSCRDNDGARQPQLWIASLTGISPRGLESTRLIENGGLLEVVQG